MAEKSGELLTSPAELGGSNPVEEQNINMVGFKDQALAIKNRLTGSQRRLDIISIVGMAGLGKTTLARNVYDDLYIIHHFYIRSWITISQVYQKRDLLLGILSSQIKLTSIIHRMSDENLSAELYRCLKGKRYLIVMDDIWNIDAWNDMRRCFPNDNNGSRILFTSRLKEVALRIKPDSTPHELRFLLKDESWSLLQEKAFSNGSSCPLELIEVGKKIAEKCRGLPLSLVVVGGLLAKTEKTLDWWKQVAKSLSSYIVEDQTQCMDTLALSYNHLPDHLKPCFLYIGAFPEDYEIPVSKLIWLWIAEGFIEKNGLECPEDVAEGYLQDLIERSLMLIINRRSSGRIKSCRIHDLLGDLCRKKAKEEKFLEHIYRYEQVSPSSSPIADKGSRLCIYMNLIDYISSKPSSQDVCSFFYFANKWSVLPLEFTPFIYEAFTHLRVLDVFSIHLEHFPTELALLVHLRYLALRANVSEIPASVSTLKNLETLIVKGMVGIIRLPNYIWNMKRLRHLHVNEGSTIDYVTSESNQVICSTIDYVTSESNQVVFGMLEDLQTLSTLVCSTMHSRYFVDITPNLRKLRCIVYRNWFLSFPAKLETLKVLHRGMKEYSHLDNLPLSLKKISLENFDLLWSEISKLGRLPNLEVLKLRYINFDGPVWEATDGEFPQLKFLKLEGLNIEQWNASSEHFPCLERLVLSRCKELKEIPLALGDISTLQMIEVRWCSKSAANSARQISEEQETNGKEELKVIIHPPHV